MIKQWYVYLVECSDGSYYTGITTDLTRRLNEHNYSTKRGAKYTRSRRPVTLLGWYCCHSQSDALREEYKIKKMKRQDKLKMFQSKNTP
jgi:putative endonuclease